MELVMSSDSQNNNQDYRSSFYEEYVSTFKHHIPSASFDHYKKIFDKQFLPLIEEFNKNASLIEFGCGAGNELQLLREKGYTNLFGIDISPEQIQKARIKGLNVEQTDVFRFLEVNEKKFDIIFALDFVEHFDKREILKLFGGFSKILKTGGKLILRTPNGEGLFPGRIIYGDLTHMTIFNSYSLTQLLLKTGFTDIKLFESIPVENNFSGLIRTILWRVIKFIIKIMRASEGASTINILTQNLICTSKKDTPE